MAKVSLKDQLGRVIKLDAQATSGATVGKDLRWPNGSLVKESELKQSATTGTTGNASPTLWKLIREIPDNIQKLAALAGTGWATRQSDGEWSLRTLQAGDGIEIANGDAEAGDPEIGLADLADTGTGAALVKITRDAKGRIAGTEAATTDDLPEGATNHYFPEAPEDGKTYGRKDGDWSEVVKVALSLPIMQATGILAELPLTSDYKVQIRLVNGTDAYVPAVSA